MPELKRTIPALFVAVMISSGSSHTEDLAYVSDEELSSELTGRQNDIARTRSRLSSLAADELRALQELTDARTDAKHIQELVTARAVLLYRLSQSGGSLRYLLGSSSASDLLKRLGLLRRLLREGLESQRQSGLRLAEAENRLDGIRREQTEARSMLALLEEALGEILAERASRGATQQQVVRR